MTHWDFIDYTERDGASVLHTRLIGGTYLNFSIDPKTRKLAVWHVSGKGEGEIHFREEGAVAAYFGFEAPLCEGELLSLGAVMYMRMLDSA